MMVLGLPLSALAQSVESPVARMAALVNEARIAQGLNPLAISRELTAAAEAHGRDMATHGYMEHEGRDGSSPQQRAIRHGYTVPARSAWIVIEVISARGTAEAAANWLLTDPLHRGVMLRPYFREMGVSYVQGGPYGQFWTIDFGCRPNVLPVLAEPTAAGVSLNLTNEDCAPGGSSDVIGKATQVMVSDRSDFAGAAWEPFVRTKTIAPSGPDVHVKLRDASGREVISTASVAGAGLAAATTAPAVTIPTVPTGVAQKPAQAGSEPLFDVGGAGLLEPNPSSGQR